MTVTGVDFVALQVRDLDRSAAFYTDQLGLTRVPQSPPGAVVFATEPIPFAVREPLPGVDLDAGPRPGNGVAVWLRCADTPSMHERLEQAGVTIAAPPSPGPFGSQCTIADPDGYLLTLHDGG